MSTAIPGPWAAETAVTDCGIGHGLAVIAVLPELEKRPGATPTRGMVAWVHSRIGACETDEQAIDTARLIAAAPDLLRELRSVTDTLVYLQGEDWETVKRARAAIAKAAP